jgi:CCR4-NOT transcriptional regulation complex NOT5 subunit
MPHYALPACYYYLKRPSLRPRDVKKLSVETLFYVFYTQPRDSLQVAVAKELMQRMWWYHKAHKLWFRRPTSADGPSNSRFIYFDVNAWERRHYVAPGGTAPLGEADFMAMEEIEQASVAIASGGDDG